MKRFRTSAAEGRRTYARLRTVVAGFVLLSFTLTSAQAGTTVTSYTYNPDGALTAVTERTGVATATTTYLTWDNFVPDADDPSTGTIYTGNGNLLAIGPEPGKATKQFSFDERDRLTAFQASDKASIYGYHADGLMASATADNGSGLGFYYAGSAMANLRQTDNDLWSARLGPVRYLDDGTEEILLAPRKDVAGVYDPDARTVTAYNYDDAFGAESDVPLADGYDLKDNPHRYAGEFRDPLWGGYYLKARWYEPDLATFLSRDPKPGYHPYNYGDGNPVMNIDPTGMSAKRNGAEQFLYDAFIEPFAQLGSKQFWDAKNPSLWFMLAGIATEGLFAVGEMAAFDQAWSLAFRKLSVNLRFGGHNGLDLGLQSAQIVQSSFDHGQFKSELFGYTLATSAVGMGGILATRMLGGIDYRKYPIRGKELSKIIMNDTGQYAHIFAQRKNMGFGWTTPWQESKNLGNYHSKIVVVTKSYYAENHVKGWTLDSGKYSKMETRIKGLGDLKLGTAEDWLAGGTDRNYEYIGKIPMNQFNLYSFFHINPTDAFPNMKGWSKAQKANMPTKLPQRPHYDQFTNNCHHHSRGIIRILRDWMGLKR